MHEMKGNLIIHCTDNSSSDLDRLIRRLTDFDIDVASSNFMDRISLLSIFYDIDSPLF